MPAEHKIDEIHVVCNTHWDREFRETFELTRRNLLDMFDVLLTVMERDPRYTSFTLDAHAILVEDYLEMRPERRPQVERLLRERRLLMGPWYTLPDSMNVGGEALVRNFLRAQRVAAALGTTCMTAGYSPNNWGQPSQMPQIFRGFGVDSALIYRGISLHECPSEFIWEGPDGSEICGHRFAKLARYNWYYLVYRPVTRGVEPTDKYTPLEHSDERPFRVVDGHSRATPNFRLLAPREDWDAERLPAALDAMLKLEGPDSSTGLFLAMHGHDVSVAHPHDPDMVAAADAAAGDDVQVCMSNLETFIARVRARLDRDKAVRLKGERRMNLKTGFWTYLLPCTISARTYLKVLNTAAENALASEAEPLASLAATLGAPYPTRYLDRAWQFLLTNHTHDANAGCAPDRVCADMEYRYRQCLDIASVCSEDALRHIALNLKPVHDGDGDVHVLVCNSLAQPRSEVIALDLAVPAGEARDGLVLEDAHGHVTPIQIDEVHADSLFVDNQWDVPTFSGVKRYRAHALVQDVPAIGYRAYRVRPQPAAATTHAPLSPAENVLENALVRVTVNGDGTVDLLHKASQRTYAGLNAYRDQGEAGNAWQQESPKQDEVITSRGGTARIERILNGPLAAALRTTVTLMLPREGDTERRSAERVPFTIVTTYALYRDDPRLHVQVDFDNGVRDHWLRAIFPTGIATQTVFADTHYDLVERAIEHPGDTGWIERFRGTAPAHAVVDLHDAHGGLTLLTQGLFEYEVFDDAERTLALSLVRSFWIKLQVSEEKLEVLPDQGVQCPGPQCFRYALLPHAGDAVASDALRWAQRHSQPLRAAQITPNDGVLPAEVGLLTVDGVGLVVTAVKRAEHADATVVRLFNCGTQPSQGRIRFGANAVRVQTARLDETPEAEISCAGDAAELTVPPKKIVTLLVEWGRP